MEFSDEEIASAVSDIKIYMKHLGLYKHIRKLSSASLQTIRTGVTKTSEYPWNNTKYEYAFNVQCPFIISVGSRPWIGNASYFVGIDNNKKLRLFRTAFVEKDSSFVPADYCVLAEAEWFMDDEVYRFDVTTGTFNSHENEDGVSTFIDSYDLLQGKMVYPKMSDKPNWIDECMKYLLGEEYYEKFWENNPNNDKNLKWVEQNQENEIVENQTCAMAGM